jgi:hypothetical protein
MEPVQVASQVLWLPKGGHRAEEYEDAFLVQAGRQLPLRAAVADGATEAAFSRTWAQRLVEGFVVDGPASPAALEDRLQAWRRAWRQTAAAREGGLPWYAAAKAREGAFAALLGLAVQADGTWQALAAGDCCLFHLRGEAVCACWPLTHPEQFGNHPALLGSLDVAADPPLLAQHGSWQPGDVFLLASDALAAWLMRTDPVAALAFTPLSFSAVVASARRQGGLRNDDVTLVRLELEAAVHGARGGT